MKQHAQRIPPSMTEAKLDNDAWVGAEASPWPFRHCRRRRGAIARRRTLAPVALAPLHEVSDPWLRSANYFNDGWVLAALGRWDDARLAFEKSREYPQWSRTEPLSEGDAWLGVARLEAGDARRRSTLSTNLSTC